MIALFSISEFIRYSYKLSIVLVLVFIFFAHSNYLLANENEPLPLTFALFETPPYVIRKEDKAVTGLFIEIHDRISQNMTGVSERRVLPLARLRRELDRESFNCSIFIDVPLVKKYFPNPILFGVVFEVGVVARNMTTLRNYEDLYNLKIAVVQGLNVSSRFDKDKNLQKISVNNYLNGMKLLALKRVDGVVGIIPGLKYSAQLLGKNLDQDFQARYIFSKNNLGVVCRDMNASERLTFNKMNDVVMKLRQQGVFHKLMDKYF